MTTSKKTQRYRLSRYGAALAALALILVVGLGVGTAAGLTGVKSQPASAGPNDYPFPVASYNGGIVAPPGVDLSACGMPSAPLTNSSSSLSLGISSPACDRVYYSLGSTWVSFIAGESIPVTIRSPAGSSLSMSALHVPPNVAVWFKPSEGSALPDGSFSTTLYFSGAWASPYLTAPSNPDDFITISVAKADGGELSLSLPVVLETPNTPLLQNSAVAIPSVVADPNTLAGRIFGLTYIPTISGSTAPKTVRFSILGVYSKGSIEPLPQELGIWFSDASDSGISYVSQSYTVNAQPGHSYYLFLKVLNRLTSVPVESPITYTIAAAEDVGATRYVVTFNITIAQAQATGPRAP